MDALAHHDCWNDEYLPADIIVFKRASIDPIRISEIS